MGRHTQGVRGLRLRDNDFVIAMAIIHNEEGTILAISENGYGKRTDASAYTVTKRGSKGVITLKTTMRNGYLASLMMVDDCDDLMIITKDGMIIRQKVENIKTISRNTQGVRLINLNDNDKVNDITRIQPEPDDEAIDRETERLAQSAELASTWESDVAAIDEDEAVDGDMIEDAEIIDDEADDIADDEADDSEE
jgi:DNA gyrase subunit A